MIIIIGRPFVKRFALYYRTVVCPVCLSWPNGCMDQDATCYGGKSRPRRHCMRWVPRSPPPKGAKPPNFRPMFIVAKRYVYHDSHCDVQPWARAAHHSCSAYRSTQPSTLRGTVKWISAFWLSNNNKWRWWMWMAAVTYRRTHSPSQLAWSEGWRPPGAQSAFIK